MTTLAEMLGDGWGHMDGWGGGWMWLWGFLMMTFWIAVIGLAVWLVMRGQDRGTRERNDRPREILAERYARGELSTDEYHERLEALR
ncbi:MAG: SHOCT domain-containing protein [Acidimicrobiia bacterium]|nr:SHOCT domain-containing protein [Acidimicrobiia bacterium]